MSKIKQIQKLYETVSCLPDLRFKNPIAENVRQFFIKKEMELLIKEKDKHENLSNAYKERLKEKYKDKYSESQIEILMTL